MNLLKYFKNLFAPKELHLEQMYDYDCGFQQLMCECNITRDESGMTFKFWDAHDTIVHLDREGCKEMYQYMTEVPSELMERHPRLCRIVKKPDVWYKELENGNVLEISKLYSTLGVCDAHLTVIKLSDSEWYMLKMMLATFA